MRKTSLAEFEAAFNEIELPDNPTVIIHSSLLRFGIIEGGVRALLELLIKQFGTEGTLCMPTFTFSYPKRKYWHALQSKSEAGSLTEYFRKREGVVRSLHPFHSICTIGPNAPYLISEISDSSFGPKSPFAKLFELNAFNISLGTNFIGGATYLHHTEESTRVPYRFYKKFPGSVFDISGQSVENEFSMYVRRMSGEYEYKENWEAVWERFEQTDLFKPFHINDVPGSVSSIRDTHSYFRSMLLAEPFFATKFVQHCQ
jgi:aminoglycoside 3-N-acetyltransferase